MAQARLLRVDEAVARQVGRRLLRGARHDSLLRVLCVHREAHDHRVTAAMVKVVLANIADLSDDLVAIYIQNKKKRFWTNFECVKFLFNPVGVQGGTSINPILLALLW